MNAYIAYLQDLQMCLSEHNINVAFTDTSYEGVFQFVTVLENIFYVNDVLSEVGSADKIPILNYKGHVNFNTLLKKQFLSDFRARLGNSGILDGLLNPQNSDSLEEDVSQDTAPRNFQNIEDFTGFLSSLKSSEKGLVFPQYATNKKLHNLQLQEAKLREEAEKRAALVDEVPEVSSEFDLEALTRANSEGVSSLAPQMGYAEAVFQPIESYSEDGSEVIPEIESESEPAVSVANNPFLTMISAFTAHQKVEEAELEAEEASEFEDFESFEEESQEGYSESEDSEAEAEDEDEYNPDDDFSDFDADIEDDESDEDDEDFDDFSSEDESLDGFSDDSDEYADDFGAEEDESEDESEDEDDEDFSDFGAEESEDDYSEDDEDFDDFSSDEEDDDESEDEDDEDFDDFSAEEDESEEDEDFDDFSAEEDESEDDYSDDEDFDDFSAEEDEFEEDEDFGSDEEDEDYEDFGSDEEDEEINEGYSEEDDEDFDDFSADDEEVAEDLNEDDEDFDDFSAEDEEEEELTLVDDEDFDDFSAEDDEDVADDFDSEDIEDEDDFSADDDDDYLDADKVGGGYDFSDYEDDALTPESSGGTQMPSETLGSKRDFDVTLADSLQNGVGRLFSFGRRKVKQIRERIDEEDFTGD